MERKLADRRSNFKKNFDDPRRKREDLQLQIRKTHREQNLAKKRLEAFEPQQQRDAAPFLGAPTTALGGGEGGGGGGGFLGMGGSGSSNNAAATAGGGLLGSSGTTTTTTTVGGGGDMMMGGVGAGGETLLQPQQVMMGGGVVTADGAAPSTIINSSSNASEHLQQQELQQQQQMMGGVAGAGISSNDQGGAGAGGGAGTTTTSGGAVAAAGKKYVFKGSELPDMMRMLCSDNPEDVFKATELFRRALSIESKPPIQEVIDAGAVPLFVRSLKCDDRPRLQFEAAWALTNIASGTQEQTKVVIEHGAVPVFVKLLESPTDDVREQAVWALGNIAGDSPKCRDLVLEAGALSPLLKQLNDPEVKYTMKRNATWTLSNLCRGKPQPPFEWVQPALGTLALLIYSPDVEVVTDACWALSYLSDGPNERIDAILEAAVSRRLVELLGHSSPLVQTPALRTVGNIVTGDDRQTEVVIQCGAVPALLKLLSSPKKGIQKEACWTVSNITAGNRDQIQRVLDEGLLPRLIELLKWGDFDVRREAAWAVSNAASGGNDQQVEALVLCGCIGPLCELLKTADVKIVSVALEALENVLRVGKVKMESMQLRENPYCRLIEEANGLTVLEKLQEAANPEIYDKAWRIICTYFPHEEVDEGNDIDVDSAAGGGLGPTSNAFEAESALQQQVFGAAAPQGGFNFGE